MIRIKTQEETDILKEGGRKHAEILLALKDMVSPGLSSLILEEEALRLVRQMRGEPSFLNYKPHGAKRPFPACLCVSINDEIVHGIPNEAERILRDGDIVSIDLGFTYKGLITDAAITVPVGVIDDESRRLLQASEKALEAGCKAAVPEGTVGDIGAAISEVISGTGFALAADLAGHGVGYAVHEDPFVPNVGKKGEGEQLKPGMVIAIEPMVNAGDPGIKSTADGYTIKTKDGSRSAHFEHTVAITDTGNIVLTKV